VEPAATNALSYSEEFDNAAWGKSAMTVSTGTTALFTAPDGTTNADKIIATSGNVAHNINRTGLASAAYTFSVFAKAGEESVMSLWLRGASVRAEFNLVSGTVSNITTTSARIENYGNGWYRCTVYDSTAGTTAHVYGRTGGAYAGNGSDGFYLWGAQLETGSVATSYIPTTAGTGSRSADVISVSGAVSGSIGQTAGTIYCEFAFLGTPTTRSGPIFLRQADSRGMSINFAPTDSPSGIRFSSRNNAGTTSLNIVSGALQVGTFYKVAIAYDAAGTAAGGTQASGVVAYVNGSQVAIGTFQVPDAAGLTQFRMYGANSGSDTEAFNGRIRSAALYTTRLTNDDLMLLTMPGNNTYLPQAVWDNYLSRTGNSEVPDCLYTRHADLLDV
jgi:hypothetical protein